MSRQVVRINDLSRRIPEAGRIRLGVKSGRAMRALDTFRFTSPSRELIEQLAAVYGGEVKPWNDPKASPPNQFEVITTATSIEVYLPKDSISCWYEMWAGGGVQRRCDGETVQIPVTSNDGWEMSNQQCLCVRQQKMECRPYTRLNVVLPRVSFYGVWRLETKGWNAAHEMPGMADAIDVIAQSGALVKAQLGIEKRMQMTPAGKRNFVVPKISLDLTPEQMVVGGAAINALNAPATEPVAALNAAPAEPDDDIIDAEIVINPLSDVEARAFEVCAEHKIPFDRFWPAMLSQVGASPLAATDEQINRMLTGLAKVETGSLTFVGFDPAGKIIWKR
jgi:hypothetical protein